MKASKRRMLLRPYSLMGTRSDAELLLWQIAESAQPFQELGDGDYADGDGGRILSMEYSYLSADQAARSTRFAAAHWAIRSG